MSKRTNNSKYYKDFGLTKNDKEYLKKQELYNLYKRPKKDTKTNTPHFDQTYGKDVDHQADLLFMPEDQGYNYALVVTDIATRLSDAVPLKGKSSKEVLAAFKKIYKRGILKLPENVYMDSGSEFHKEVKKYFDNEDVTIKFGKPGRHRQMSVVERTNQYIAKAAFMRMHAQEILTGEVSKEWIEDLPKFIKAINKKRGKKPPKPATTMKCEGDACNILSLGTKVRVNLDYPIDYTSGNKLHGKFRITDIRWNPIIKTIKNILLLPGRPPLYLVNKDNSDKIDNSVAYTKNQLQVVSSNEEPPEARVVRGNPGTFVVQKILDKKKEKGKFYYEVKWKGQKDTTWEPRSTLLEDVPQMVKEFDEQN